MTAAAAARLGLRWALRPGPQRRRTLMSATGTVAATSIVLAAIAMASPVGQVSSCGPHDVACQGRVQLLSFCAFGVPGLVLTAVLARLSASTRSEQTQALRELGVSRVQLVVATVTEVAVVAVAGVLTGAVVATGTVAVLGALDLGAAQWLGPGGVLLGGALVVGTAVVSAVVATRPDLSRTVRAPDRRVSWWRAAPLLTGGICLVAAAPVPAADGGFGLKHGLWALGVIGCVVGLPWATPIVVRLVASVCTRPGSRPVLRLAGRSLHQAPAATSRILATLSVAVILAVFLQGVWNDIAAGPLTAASIRAETDGPNLALVTADAPLDADDIPEGTLGAVPLRIADCQDSTCFGVLVATCADARVLAGAETPCAPGGIAELTDEPGPAPGTSLVLDDGSVLTLSTTARSEALPATASVAGQRLSSIVDPAVLTSPPPPASRTVVMLAPGNDRITALADAMSLRSPGVAVTSITGGPEEYRRAMAYRLAIYAAIGCALLAAVIGLLLASTDRALERRDLAADLQVLGMPHGLVRRALVVEQAAPLVVLVPAAAAIGAAASIAMLGSPPAVTPPGLVALRTALCALVGTAALMGPVVAVALRRVRP